MNLSSAELAQGVKIKLNNTFYDSLNYLLDTVFVNDFYTVLLLGVNLDYCQYTSFS